MPIHCPHCETPIIVSDDFAGYAICPGCGSSVNVRDELAATKADATRRVGKFELRGKRRWLGGEPILARQVGTAERVWRWSRRNPMAAASLTGIVGAFLAAFVLVSWSYWRAEVARQVEATQRLPKGAMIVAGGRDGVVRGWNRRPPSARSRSISTFTPPKGYVCYRADRRPLAPREESVTRSVTPTITIDGQLDESAWQTAPWTDDFGDIEGDLKPPPRFRTRAKLLWDDDYFYIAAELDEPHVWGTLTVRDSVIFHDNDFEVFIDPDGDSHNYGEFEINALNTGWDLRLPKPYKDGGRADDGWEITGIKTAVHVVGTLNDPRGIDQGWTIEIAIPWSIAASLADLSAPIRTARRNGSVFESYEPPPSPLRPSPPVAGGEGRGVRVPPRDGDQWRVNFSRVEWRHRISADGKYEKIPNTREDNWVWSPQGTINMHRPETWGYVQFSTAAVGSDAARAVKFTSDPAGPAKHLLARLYYAQIAFRMKNDRFSQTIDALNLGDFTHASLAGPITLEVVGDSFEAIAVVRLADGSAARWHIREDSRIWLESR